MVCAHVFTLKRCSESNAFVAMLRETIAEFADSHDEYLAMRVIRERRETHLVVSCQVASWLDNELEDSRIEYVANDYIFPMN